MAIYVQGLQDVIDTAVNIELNRTKLVAQTVSRSGRISTSSRNWANPYRFTITPKPIWAYADARAMIESIYYNDRYESTNIYFGDYPNSQGTTTNPVFAGYISGQVLTVTGITSGTIRTGDIISGTGIASGTQVQARISGYGANSIWLVSISQTVGSSGSPIAITGNTTSQGNPGQNWISYYRGSQDTDNGDYIIDNYSSYTASGTAMIIQEQTGETAPANDFIIRANDFIRIANDRYCYQATRSIPVPVAKTGVTGTIVVGTTSTTITGLSTVTGLSQGQVLTKTSGTGTLGTNTYIQTIDSATQITIASTTACTAGSITFDGDGTGNTNHKVAIQLNRGYLGDGQAANSALFVGAGAARFTVKVTKLPTYKFINKDYIEFTGDFELIEEIL